MATLGITNIRLGADGRIALVRWQEVNAAGLPAGRAQESSIEQLAAAVGAGERVAFWGPLRGGQRARGGELLVERDESGRPLLVESRPGAVRLLDLPRF
jgi:hypothetical protein